MALSIIPYEITLGAPYCKHPVKRKEKKGMKTTLQFKYLRASLEITSVSAVHLL